MNHASIIIVHYGKIDDFGETAAGKNPPKRSDLLKTCVESVIKHTRYPAELIVVDNGGDPDDSDYLLQKAREGFLTHVRFPQNMHFAFAWNQGAKLATGDPLIFMCNDIEVTEGWLEECMRILGNHKSEKIIATPFITYDKRRMNTVMPNGDRMNPRAGSNCLAIWREDFYTIGEWPHHRIGGTIWYNTLKQKGYRTMAPPKDLAGDRGWRHGLNFDMKIEIKKRLLDGTEVHFELPQ